MVSYLSAYCRIPVAFQVATLLAAFAHPGHVVFLRSRGFAQLPSRSNMKPIGYVPSVQTQAFCFSLAGWGFVQLCS